ncbi:MAG: DNA-deoxyinosine glycosylase [Oscillospiraceae bacterium]|nr:DNA-deoxyinosine glycosylase [Oscillospiraceae bacterium]
MERQYLTHGFPPFYDADSEILILGSFPSVKSREAQFFYGHPQNRFWRVIAAVYGERAPESVEEKRAFLTRSRIALYDVIEECSIIGSADSTIADVVPADIGAILSATRVGERVFTNGGKAYDLYMKLIFPTLGVAAAKLPSTSPANAAWSLEKLTAAWEEIIKPAG